MSWFTRSIANTLQLDADKDVSTDQKEDDSPLSPGKGVKEDLSEVTKTLTTKLWAVASFLAPPPPAEHSNQQSDPSDPAHAAPETIAGIRRDFAEIGGRFRSGISKLSNNIDVSEITKLASNILQLSPDGDEAIGVTDEVLAFVRDVTMHPETWMDFPLSEDEEDGEDFELSDAQQDHALAVERLAPRLAALRIELCPGYMSESSFWKIYFVLLHPRLEPHAAELLSTPEIVKARASLTHNSKAHSSSQTQEKHSSVPSGTQSETVPLEVSTTPLTTSVVSADTEKTEKQPDPTEEIQIVDKSVIQEEPRNETRPENQKVPSKTTCNVVEDKDEDDWLKEDSSENVNITGTTAIPIENDEDVSFSDLEDDDDDDGDDPTKYQKMAPRSDLPTKDSHDWVQLGSGSLTADHAGKVSAHNSEKKESNDWLDVDDIDVA
ncbi:hypothetical protein L1987_46973 [Smallanthus sonchifolius]|uniref:Uncharacterized protein n=1 Tax=Smallanthus sonchifolius TaxID=185202 RepID=A0ACB9G320_9ASTR|nr:hypothetical protein L1987_46973 [Smallanthus sonchifolius]